MFLEKYLNPLYLDLVYSNYEEDFLKSLDEDNFNKIYLLLKRHSLYFIDDVILNYLELFEIEENYVEKALSKLKLVLGNDLAKEIGKNMTIIDKIIELAIDYSTKE